MTATVIAPPALAPAPVVRDEGDLNGVAELFKTVIEEKLEDGPYKAKQLAHMNLDVLVHVVDVGQSATMGFRRDGGGTATISSGGSRKADLKVECDNETVTQFTMFRLLPGGIPNFFDENGRSVVGKLLTRKLVIRGLVRHLRGLVLFIRLFSIPADE